MLLRREWRIHPRGLTRVRRKARSAELEVQTQHASPPWIKSPRTQPPSQPSFKASESHGPMRLRFANISDTKLGSQEHPALRSLHSRSYGRNIFSNNKGIAGSAYESFGSSMVQKSKEHGLPYSKPCTYCALPDEFHPLGPVLAYAIWPPDRQNIFHMLQTFLRRRRWSAMAMGCNPFGRSWDDRWLCHGRAKNRSRKIKKMFFIFLNFLL